MHLDRMLMSGMQHCRYQSQSIHVSRYNTVDIRQGPNTRTPLDADLGSIVTSQGEIAQQSWCHRSFGSSITKVNGDWPLVCPVTRTVSYISPKMRIFRRVGRDQNTANGYVPYRCIILLISQAQEQKTGNAMWLTGQLPNNIHVRPLWRQ